MPYRCGPGRGGSGRWGWSGRGGGWSGRLCGHDGTRAVGGGPSQQFGQDRSSLPSTVLAAPTTYAVSVPEQLSPGGAAPRAPQGRRRWLVPVALGLAGVACCLGVTGCAQFNKALGQQQALVYFK